MGRGMTEYDIKNWRCSREGATRHLAEELVQFRKLKQTGDTDAFSMIL